MRYKVLTGFSGLIDGRKDSVIEITNDAIASDLVNAGYIEAVETEKPKKTTKKAKTEE